MLQPPPPNPHSGDPASDLAVRMLYEEQTRLRAELEVLREQQAKQADKDKQEGGEQGGGEKGEEKGGQEKGGGKEKSGEGEEQKKKQPPLRLRATTWVKGHPILTTFMAIGFVILLIAVLLLVRYLDSYTDTDDAFIDGHTDPISPRISGIVTKVYVENTYHVAKGQLLVELDARDNQVSKEQAGANYAQAQASVRAQAPNVPVTATNESTEVANTDYDIVNSQANVDAAQERYHAAVADLHQAEANQANAAREEERYRMLVVKEEVSREQYDQHATDARAQEAVVASRRETAEAAAKAVTQAQAQLGQAKQRHEQAKQNLPKQVAIQKEMLAQRQANELSAKAQADQAELNLEYTHIYAPEDGIIGDKQVQVATQVAPGQELFALTQTNDIWVTANFKETQIRRMRAGQAVTIHVDALSMDFKGHIQALPGASGAVYSLLPPENATGNYVKVVQRLPVRISIDPHQDGWQRLAPGMSVEPKVWLR